MFVCCICVCVLMYDGENCEEKIPEMEFLYHIWWLHFSMLGRKSGTKYLVRKKDFSCLIPSAPCWIHTHLCLIPNNPNVATFWMEKEFKPRQALTWLFSYIPLGSLLPSLIKTWTAQCTFYKIKYVSGDPRRWWRRWKLHSPPPTTKLDLQLKHRASSWITNWRLDEQNSYNQGVTEKATSRLVARAKTWKRLPCCH